MPCHFFAFVVIYKIQEVIHLAKIRKQTFLKGAFILVVANVVVKIIGMFFKVPLTYLLGEDGMGMFNTSYTLYTFMFVVATAGFPIAVSKMVSEAMARDNKKEADKIFFIAVFVLGIIGAMGAGLLFFFAKPFAQMLGNGKAAEGIMAIAPAVFFVSIMSAFRGYFQGRQNMYPTAFSEVIEASGKLLFGYVLAAYFLTKGLEYASGGAVFGVTCGTLLSVIFLLITFMMTRSKEHNNEIKCKSFGRLAKELIYIAVPVTIGASVASLTNVADLLTIMNRLQSIGLDERAASTLYGAYSGYAVPMFNMPLTLVTAISVSVVPAIAGALEVGKKLIARTTTEIALRITVLFALPSAIGLSVLANPILALIFNNTNSTSMLQKLGIAVVFVSLLSVTNAVLQAYGKMKIPVINMLIGGIIKVALNFVLIPIYGIDAAPVSTCICYFSIVVMNMVWIIKITGVQLRFWDFIVKPLIAVGVMAVSIIYANNMLLQYGINLKMAGMASALFGGIIYFIMLFIVKAIHREEIEMLPNGKKVANFLEKINFLRK